MEKEYRKKIIGYQENKKIFREDAEDKTRESKQRVKEWARKWERRGEIGEDVMNWVQKENTKPGNIYANIKVYKEGWPCRFIIS